MRKLNITEFNKGKVRLNGGITCSVGQIIKLGLLGYLYSDSELQLCQYLIIKELKFLGCLTDYKLENCWLRYQGQAKEVELHIPAGVVALEWCFLCLDIEKLCLYGSKVNNLYSLVGSCGGLREVAIDIDFSNKVIDLRWCFSGTLCLERATFNKVARRARVNYMFCESGIKEIRLSGYVINVEDNARKCFYKCKELVDLDCSGVKFNKDVLKIVGKTPKLETISFRNCWFGGRIDLILGDFLHPVTIDLRGARCRGIEGVKSLSKERGKNKAVDEFIAQFELEKVTLILD